MFLTPGSRMEGRKGYRGKGDTNLIGQVKIASTTTVVIPKNCTRARVFIYAAGGGGGAGAAGCCVNPPGTGGAGGPPSAGYKTLTNLVPGETLTVTVGAGGGAGSGTGGATSISSGSCQIGLVQINGSSGGAYGTYGTTGGNGTFGAIGALDYGFQQGIVLPAPYSGMPSFYYWGAYGLGYGGPGGNGGGGGAAGTSGFVIIEWMM